MCQLKELINSIWIVRILERLTAKQSIYLLRLAQKHKLMYEPEQFPAAILKLEQPYTATVLLFASGKAVILGLTHLQQISKITSKVMKMIE